MALPGRSGLAVPTGLLITATLAREFGPEGYGLFSLAIVLVSWIEMSITSIFSRSTIKLVSDARDWRPVALTVVRWHLFASCAAAVLLWLLVRPLAAALGALALVPYLRLLVPQSPQ